MDRPRRIKQEPPDEGAPRVHGASPAQEATRARIATLEAQLGRMKAPGRTDSRNSLQIRCLEEELRKAHSKLRRLLNEAERQRRRRERLRSGVCVRTSELKEEGVMTALRSCSRLQDFKRELNTLGFTLMRNDETLDDGETMPEVDGVKVQVELIEGVGDLNTEIKYDNTESSSSSENPLLTGFEDGEDSGERSEESYRQWFERQIQMQQRWEMEFMREQMELARSLLESVTTTFLQGVQQVLSNVTAGRRFPPFFPDPPQ